MKTQDLINLKLIKTDPRVNQLFKNRFSPRFFAEDDIKDEDLKIIFDAVKLTPSSYNLQPWYFYVFKNKTKSFDIFSSLLLPGNDWAKKAPVLILGCYIEKSNYGKNYYAQYDLGQAVITLVYQAQELGYYTHQMAGFDRKKAEDLIKNKQHVPWVMIALGKIGDYEKAPKELIIIDGKKRERKEKIFEISE